MLTPLVRPEVAHLRPYVPGKPIGDVQREYGLSRVVKLASNENPLGPSPLALRALEEAARGVHIYPEATSRALREALASHVGLTADWNIIGNGSDEILRLLAATYIRSGDRCLVPSCSFPNYRAVSSLFGATVEEVPLRAEAMDLAAMADRSPGARFIFLCRPNNPTGAVFPADDFVRFLGHVSTDTLVLVDQAYFEFDETGFSGIELLSACPNLILTRTFSKAYGLAGLRVGYGMAHPDLLRPLYAVREPFSVSVLAQAAATAALADREHLQATLDNNRVGRLFLAEACRDLGLFWIPSEANFVMIDLGRPAGPVYEELLRRGIIVRPCEGFGRPTWIRVSIGTPSENQEFAEGLRQTLQG